MKLVKVIIFLYFFCNITTAIEIDSTVSNICKVQDTLSIKTNYSDSVYLKSGASENKSSASEVIGPVDRENRRDTSIIINYTSNTQKPINIKDIKDTIKVVSSTGSSENTEDSLKIKYPYYYKNSKAVKIVAAIGTSAAIGGIISFIVIKQMKISSPKKSDIPDPPLPPSY
ncbi:MAG: hypothetical protein N2053_07645 [Chitinispirillaceae bacterium]|nr:hypothetical protein [Chitinispirillaceae bacterium]